MSETTKTPIEEVIEPVAAEKPYKFRMLGGQDVFLMFKIIGKIGVKEFNACFQNDGIKNLVASMMGEQRIEGQSASVTYIEIILEVADVIFKNIPKCENEIFQMLSQTSDLTVEQVKGLSFAEFTDMVIDFIKKEEFRDFIKVVSRLFK